MKIRNTLAIIILAIGSLQMLGYLLDSKVLRGLGLASGISPYTKVFCAADGYEAFAADFHLTGLHPDGSPWTCDLTPELYAELKGPYNRRNVYGATLAFAPRLPTDLRDQLLEKSLAPGSSLRQELNIPSELSNLQVHIHPRQGESNPSWTFPHHPPSSPH